MDVTVTFIATRGSGTLRKVPANDLNGPAFDCRSLQVRPVPCGVRAALLRRHRRRIRPTWRVVGADCSCTARGSAIRDTPSGGHRPIDSPVPGVAETRRRRPRRLSAVAGAQRPPAAADNHSLCQVDSDRRGAGTHLGSTRPVDVGHDRSQTITPWEPCRSPGRDGTAARCARASAHDVSRWKADGLDAAGLQTRIGASALTLGGLLKHLAVNEDYIFATKLTRRADRRAVGRQRLGRQRRLGVHLRRRRHARAALRALGRRGRAVRARGSTRPWPTAGSTSSSHVSAPDGRHASLRRLRLRPDRGVRPAHRARRPAAQSERPGSDGSTSNAEDPRRVVLCKTADRGSRAAAGEPSA